MTARLELETAAVLKIKEGPPPATSMAQPPRLQWIFGQFPIFYLTMCSYRRRRILARPDVHQTFKTFCLQADQYGVIVGRYVLMPDHIHLIAAFADGGISLSNWVKSLKNAISKTLKVAGFRSPHWEKGSFDHILRSGESYNQKRLYVRDNPVRAGLVRKAEDWPFAGDIHEIWPQD